MEGVWFSPLLIVFISDILSSPAGSLGSHLVMEAAGPYQKVILAFKGSQPVSWSTQPNIETIMEHCQ